MSLPDRSRAYVNETLLSPLGDFTEKSYEPTYVYPIIDYFEYLTEVSDADISEMRRGMVDGTINPMELKKQLASEITLQFHDKASAVQAERYFQSAFQKRGTPDDIPETIFSLDNSQQKYVFKSADDQTTRETTAQPTGEINTVDLIYSVGLTTSRSEAKRLLAGRAVEIDHKKVTSALVKISNGTVIKVGRRRFVRLVDIDDN